MSKMELADFESYAMEGEDLILRSLLRKKATGGSYFDIGSGEPVRNSNTYLLYKQGWRGVAVDGRDLSHSWGEVRPGDFFVHGLCGKDNGEIEFWTFPDGTMNTADPITAERYSERFGDSDVRSTHLTVTRAYDLWQKSYKQIVSGPLLPTLPDVVSIDVEGFEIHVLKGLLEPNPRWRPCVLVVETKLFKFLDPLQSEIANYLIKKHSYSLISKTPLNAFFIDPLNPLFDWLPPTMLRSSC